MFPHGYNPEPEEPSLLPHTLCILAGLMLPENYILVFNTVSPFHILQSTLSEFFPRPPACDVMRRYITFGLINLLLLQRAKLISDRYSSADFRS